MNPITPMPIGINSLMPSLVPTLAGRTASVAPAPQLDRSLGSAPLSGNLRDQLIVLAEALLMYFLGASLSAGLFGAGSQQQSPVGSEVSYKSNLSETEMGTEESSGSGGPAESGASAEPGAPGASQGTGSSKPSKSGHKELDQWDAQIEAAAKSTGLPANYIKATIWAESRGNPNDPSNNPDGKHQDLGVMQISDYTYGDVMKNQPNAPRGLKAGNPADNIMMGAWELKDKSEKANGDLFKTSMAYVGTGDAHEKEYAKWVETYMRELDEGKPLSDF